MGLTGVGVVGWSGEGRGCVGVGGGSVVWGGGGGWGGGAGRVGQGGLDVL